MKRLVYVSRTELAWNFKTLNELANKAAFKNKQLNITGFLFYDENRFLQYLEGDIGAVDSLYSEIALDKRHSITHCISQNDVTGYYFPEWSMANLRRVNLIDFGMENMLLSYMMMFDGSVYPKSEKHDIKVWEMIAKLSFLREEIKL